VHDDRRTAPRIVRLDWPAPHFLIHVI
jgi:hypothetical protein